MRRQCAYLVWLLAGLAATLFASGGPATAASPSSAYLYRRWTTEDGLPHNTVSSLHQSPAGHLWVGTWFGAARFDGQRFQALSRDDAPAMAAGVVNDFASHPDGTVWLATGGGLVRITGQTWGRSTAPEGPPGHRFWRVKLSPGGALWGLSDQGAFRLMGGRVQTFGPLPNRQEQLLAALPEGERALRFAQIDGCFRLDTFGVFTPVPLPGAPPVPWRAAEFDAAGALWLATGTNVWQPSAAGFNALPLPEAPPNEAIRHLAFAGPGELWVGTNRRLLHLRSGRWQVASPLAEEWSIHSLLVDRERNVWVGVEGQGLVRVRPKQIQSFTRQDGLPHDQCLSVTEAGDGAIWVGTQRSLGWVRDGRAGAGPDPGLFGDYHVHSVLSDRRGRIIEAVDKLGLFEFRDGRHEPMFGLTFSMHALLETRDGTIWIGGERIAQVAPDGTKHERPVWPGGNPRSIRAFHESRTGAVWIGTYGDGLYRLVDGQFTRWTRQDGLPSDRVWAFLEEADGTLWLGTDGGLGRFQAGRFATLTTAHGLPENVINHILADDLGHFWISCNRGIYRVAAAELHAVADGRQPRAHIRLYGEREGMANAETNGENQPAGCKARDGRLWFPTVKGVVALDPRDFRDDTNAPPVLLEELQADGVPRWREEASAGSPGPLLSLSTAEAHARVAAP